MAANVVTSHPETAKVPPLFPFLDLRAQFKGIREEIMDAIAQTMQSQRFILGPEVEALESEIAEYVGCRYAVACASGSDALLLALMAVGVSPGDEVITTPFTFVATAGSIVRLGAEPVFVDIDPATYNLDPIDLARVVSPKTRAVIPVHLYGLPAAMDSILEFARQHKLAVIEDAAQALGAECGGVKVGNLGTIGAFSFFPSKNLGCAGDGGMMTTNDPELADRLRLLRVHGSRKKYHCELIGLNSRLDALQAAILRVKLRHLETWTQGRRENADRYRSTFRPRNLDTQVILPTQRNGLRHVYNQFVVRLLGRDEVRQHLLRMGIPTEIYYPEPLHLQPAFSYLGYKRGDFPHAETASQQVLALPIYPELTEEQQSTVVDAIAQYYQTN
ncbi:MAG TPA: DegT/DnrJ/EryC1/StrS family aminotransferase [Acidobacteriota bacterium]|nr:DegT/DnrJ/EryC1/StrS family aminotransferase [Acidobacteriota bacterium]